MNNNYFYKCYRIRMSLNLQRFIKNRSWLPRGKRKDRKGKRRLGIRRFLNNKCIMMKMNSIGETRI